MPLTLILSAGGVAMALTGPSTNIRSILRLHSGFLSDHRLAVPTQSFLNAQVKTGTSDGPQRNKRLEIVFATISITTTLLGAIILAFPDKVSPNWDSLVVPLQRPLGISQPNGNGSVLLHAFKVLQY